MTKLLIVDDSALMRKHLRTVFEETGAFEIRTARNGRDALEQIGTFNPDVVAGVGFSVVARELRGLAQWSRDAVADASRTVSAIRGSVEMNLLAARSEERTFAEQAHIGGLLRDVDALSAAFTLVGATQAELGELDERNRAIGLQVMQTFGQVQFQDVVRQQIEAIADAIALLHPLLDLQRDALGGIETSSSVTPAVIIEKLRANYVTRIQRENDARASGGQAHEALPDIELF